MNDIDQIEGIDAQYEAIKGAVDAVYEYDGGYLFCDDVLSGELNKGLYSRLERFADEVGFAQEEGNREFEIKSMEAYIRTARKLDGIDLVEQ
jgi:hypothetical protein